MVLHTIVKEKDYKFEQFVDFLSKTLGQEQMKHVNKHFYSEWGIPDQAFDTKLTNEDLKKLSSNPFKIGRSPSSNLYKKNSKNRNEAVDETMAKFEGLIDSFTTKQEQLDQFK